VSPPLQYRVIWSSELRVFARKVQNLIKNLVGVGSKPTLCTNYDESIIMKYIFRGEVVFEYKEDTDELKTGIVAGIGYPAINYCKFIDEDFILMEKFFADINKFKKDNTFKLEDIVVN